MNTEDKYQKARIRVEEIKGFYIHLVVYVLVNALLFLIDITMSPGVFWFYWPLLGWGTAIVLHAVSVFGSDHLSSTGWEEKKIREIMEEYDDTNTNS